MRIPGEEGSKAVRRKGRTLATLAAGAAAALGAALAVAPLAAATGDGQFAVEEAGRTTCTHFVTAREKRSSSYARLVGFLEGYMTAANRYEPNTFDLTPWHNAEALGLIVDQFCRKDENRQESLAMAAQRLVAAMQPYRLAEYSGLVQVKDGSSEARVYETILKRAQTELARKGLYRGQLDGHYSPALKTAFQDFQRSAKLDPTGIPDTPTLWVLLNP